MGYSVPSSLSIDLTVIDPFDDNAIVLNSGVYYIIIQNKTTNGTKSFKLQVLHNSSWEDVISYQMSTYEKYTLKLISDGEHLRLLGPGGDYFRAYLFRLVI